MLVEYYFRVRSLSVSERIPVLTGVLVTLTVFPWLMDPINIPKLTVLVLGAGVSLSLVIFNNGLKYEFKNNKILNLLIILFTFFLILSSLFTSQNFFTSLIGMWGRNNGLLCYLAFIALFISVARSKKITVANYIVSSLTFLGFIFGIYAWLQYFKLDFMQKLFPWYNFKSIVALTLGNSNFASVFLGLTFTASIGYFLNADNSKVFRVGAFISTGIQWLLVPYLDTQGKLIYAIGGSIAFGVWLSSSSTRKIKVISFFWWPSAVTVGVLGLTGLFGIGPFAQMLANNVVNLKDRYYHWLAAINMIKDNLIFGVGIDSFGDFHRRYRVIESIEARGTPLTSTDNAHNVFFQLGATAGLPLMIIYLSLVIFITWRGINALRIQENKLVVGTLLGIWAGYQVQSLVSIDQLGISVWSWIVGGSLVGLSRANISGVEKINLKKIIPSEPARSRNKSRFGVILVFALTPSILVLPTFLNENMIFQKWYKLGISKSQAEAVINSEALFVEALRSNQPKLRITISDSLGEVGAIDKALQLAQQTTVDFPIYMPAWDVVARIYESNNKKDLAIPARSKTVELDPLNEIFKSQLAQDLSNNSE
jgi:O-antigen ligase